MINIIISIIIDYYHQCFQDVLLVMMLMMLCLIIISNGLKIEFMILFWLFDD